MNSILHAIISRSRTVLSTLAFMLLAGTIAYLQIPKEAEPDIQFSMVFVNVSLEGVSPVDAERLLVRPLEEQFKNLDDVKEVTAKAFQGGASVTVEFEPNVDIEYAVQEVRNKVDMARPEMPSEMNEPLVSETSMSRFPMMIVTLSGDLSERALMTYAREFRDEVRTLIGVMDAEITGQREEVVEIVVDPARAESYRLNSDDLAQVFSRANRLVAAGKLDTGQGSFSVTVPGLFERREDILNMPIKVRGNAVVRVRDIAEINRTFKDATSFVRVNGKPAVAIEIRKRQGENLILTSEAVRSVIEREREIWPDTMAVNITQDQSINVREQIGGLQNSVLLAVFLVMAAVIAALGARSGVLVGLAIPGAFLMGILFLSLAGLSINNVVMFGLILSVGILVDGAIVVTEYADRKMAEGLHRSEAYIMAAQRMAWPIISSTATTVAAFIPLLFWPGFMGQMMVYMPVTLICVLTGSLLMALIFVPALGRLIGKRSETDEDTMAALSGQEVVEIGKLKGATKAYVQILNLALRHPAKVVAFTVSLLIIVPVTYLASNQNTLFFPETEPDRANLLIHGRGNLAAEEKDALINEVERRILDIDDFATVYARSGASGGGAADDVIGQITLNFKDWQERRPVYVVLKEVSERMEDLPGIRVEAQAQRHGFRGAKPVAIELSSNFSEPLFAAVANIRRAMDEIGGFIDTEDTRPLPGIEWRLEVDRAQAARFGADLTSVGSAVRLITNGVKLATFRPDDSDEEIDIIVRYPSEYRSMTQLDKLRIQTAKGLVPISNFVSRVPTQQETEIERVGNTRVMKIESGVEVGKFASAQLAELRNWLTENPIDQRVRVTFKGDDQDQRESSSFLIAAFGFGLFLMAAILLIQFNSFYSVLLILSAVIMSTIGVLLGYMLTGNPFTVVMSGIGLIALAGIVVNNNIVLIDTFDRLIKTAPTALDAVIQTGAQRLRPVFLTTFTTVLGLLPMANAVSIDFVERAVAFNAPSTMWWQQLAMTIIFGLIFATILTLFVTPSALMLKVRNRDKAPEEDTPVIPGHVPAE